MALSCFKRWTYILWWKMVQSSCKSLSRLLRSITSNHHGDFYCLNYSCRTKNRLKEHEELCNNHDCCRIETHKWFERITKFYHGEKSLKAPFTIYLDIECLLKKVHWCHGNFEKSFTERKAMHEPSGWAMFTKCSFDETENKLDYYRGMNCIKKLCEKLKDHALKIINYKEKEMIPLTDEENKFYEEQKECHICKKEFYFDKNEGNKFKL